MHRRSFPLMPGFAAASTAVVKRCREADAARDGGSRRWVCCRGGQASCTPGFIEVPGGLLKAPTCRSL